MPSVAVRSRMGPELAASPVVTMQAKQAALAALYASRSVGLPCRTLVMKLSICILVHLPCRDPVGGCHIGVKLEMSPGMQPAPRRSIDRSPATDMSMPVLASDPHPTTNTNARIPARIRSPWLDRTEFLSEGRLHADARILWARLWIERWAA